MVRLWILFSAACAWAGCLGREAAVPQPEQTKIEPAQPAPLWASPDAATTSAPGEDAGSEWTHFSRKEDVPLCLFGSDDVRLKTLFLKDVGKQTLRPRTELYFGVFAPGCASEECISRPTLQCWVEREGDVLVVFSRYSGEQRRERVCTSQCEPVIAGCPVPELAPGSYTVRYGERTMKFKLPSVLRSPCLLAD